MSQSIGSLFVKLAMDTAEFAAGAKRAEATLAGLTGALKSFGAGVLGALSLGAIASAVDDVIHKVAEIGDVAESIGITAEQLQVYNRMALASGSSSEVMAKGLQSVAEQSTDANSALSKLFAANGLSAQGRETNDVIRDFMTLLHNTRDPAEQLAYATSVLGTRVGRDLVEAFRGGAGAVDRYTQEMIKSGDGFSNAEIARVQEIETRYNEIMARIATGWQKMVIGIIEGLNAVNQLSPAGGGANRMGWDLNYKPPGPTVNMGPMGGPGQFPPIVPAIAPPKPKLKPARTGDSGPSTGGGYGGWSPSVTPITIEDIRGTTDAFQDLWDKMDSGVDTTNELNTSFQGFASSLTDEFSYALSGVVSGTSSVKDAFKEMAQSIAQQLTQLSAQLMSSTLLKLFGGLGGGLAPSQQGFFQSLFSMIGGARAMGGPVDAGKTYLVGERGPELLTMGSRGVVTPNNKIGGGASPLNVNIINNSSAQVSARKNSRGDLEVMVEEIMADKAGRGGNKFDTAMQRGYGLKRAGR